MYIIIYTKFSPLNDLSLFVRLKSIDEKVTNSPLLESISLIN